MRNEKDGGKSSNQRRIVIGEHGKKNRGRETRRKGGKRGVRLREQVTGTVPGVDRNLIWFQYFT